MRFNIVFIGILVMMLFIAGCAQQVDDTQNMTEGNTSLIEKPLPQEPSDDGEKLPDQQFPNEGFCENQCGDGQCDEIVCQAEGCPCAETPENCPQDCA